MLNSEKKLNQTCNSQDQGSKKNKKKENNDTKINKKITTQIKKMKEKNWQLQQIILSIPFCI